LREDFLRDDNLQSDDLALPSAVVDGSGPSVRALETLVFELKCAESSVLSLITRGLADEDLLHLCKMDIWTALELAEQLLQRANAGKPQPANGSREEP